tara:strand:- start:3440 stop:4240 length:801 start_codon:yes stop_codon:yes gene_type:complete
MNPIIAALKGTAMKDKKKRTGAPPPPPPPPLGVYPTGVSPHDLGVVSFSEKNQGVGNPFTNNQTMASVFIRGADLIQTGGGFGGPAQITNAAGTNINSGNNPEVVVADYVATVLQSITPPTTQANSPFPHLNSVTMEPGTVYVSTNNFGDDVEMQFIWMGYNQNFSFSGFHPAAGATIDAITNPSSIPLSPLMPATINVNSNPMETQTVNISFGTSALSSQAEIILEFTMTGGAKGQPVLTTATTNPTSGSSTFVGSCYLKIVFIA